MNLSELKNEIQDFSVSSNEQLEIFRIHFLGAKGIIKQKYAELKRIPNEQKKRIWTRN